MKNAIKTLVLSISIFFLCATTAFAQPSISVNGSIVGDVLVNGQKINGVTVKFIDEISDIDTSIQSVIEKINAGNEISEALNGVKVESEEELNLSEFKLLTKMQDLVAYDSEGNSLTNITLTWEVPNLIEDLEGIYVLHYSVKRNLWEIITPDDIDFQKKTITASFKDLSPVAVIYKYNNVIITQGNKIEEPVENKVDYKNLIYISIAITLGGIILYLYLGRNSGKKQDFDSLSK